MKGVINNYIDLLKLMKILDQLFIKNEIIDSSLYANNLYFSFDKICFLGRINKNIIPTKVYDKVDIKIDLEKDLTEGYREYKAIVEIEAKEFFVRIISDEASQINDILIYSINSRDEYDKYLNIFFSNKEPVLDDYLKSTKDLVILETDKELKIINNPSIILDLIGYEDWDFLNKHQNNLNEVIKSRTINKMEVESHQGEVVVITFTEEVYNYLNQKFIILKTVKK